MPASNSTSAATPATTSQVRPSDAPDSGSTATDYTVTEGNIAGYHAKGNVTSVPISITRADMWSAFDKGQTATYEARNVYCHSPVGSSSSSERSLPSFDAPPCMKSMRNVAPLAGIPPSQCFVTTTLADGTCNTGCW